MKRRSAMLVARLGIAALSVLAFTLAMASPADAGVEVLDRWRTGGAGPMAASEDGTIWVADGREHLRGFTPDGRGLGRLEVEPGPFDLDVGADGSVFTTGLGGVEWRTPEGELLGRAERLGLDLCFCAVAAAPDGSFYTADYDLDWLTRYAPDGSRLTVFGGTGDKPHKVRTPADIAVAPDGTVLVLDAGHSRVKRFSPDGDLLDAWGGHGWGPGRFVEPAALAVDRRGQVYVADGLGRIQRFDPSGSFVEQWGGRGSGRKRFGSVEHMDTFADRLVASDGRGTVTVMRIDDSLPRSAPALTWRAAIHRKRVQPGRVAEVKVEIINFGDAEARGVRLCPTRKAVRRGRFPAGGGCRRLGTIPARSSATAPIRVRASGSRGFNLIPIAVRSRGAGRGTAFIFLRTGPLLPAADRGARR